MCERCKELEEDIAELEGKLEQQLYDNTIPSCIDGDLAEWHDLYVMRTGDLYGLSKFDKDDVETLLKIIEEARRV